MNKGDKLSCLQELFLRENHLFFVREELMEAAAALHKMAHGKGLVKYDDTDDSEWVVMKDKRLGEQNKELYKQLDGLEEQYIGFHHYIEEFIGDIEAHIKYVYGVKKDIKEGSAIKSFVAEGRSSL